MRRAGRGDRGSVTVPARVAAVVVLFALTGLAGATASGPPLRPTAPSPALTVSFKLVSATFPDGCGSSRVVAVFSATASGGSPPYTLTWQFGDGTANASGSPVTHDYAQSGSYEVNVTATDRANSTSGTGTTVDLYPPPCPSTAGSALTFDYLVIAVVVAAGVAAVGLVFGLRGRRGRRDPPET